MNKRFVAPYFFFAFTFFIHFPTSAQQALDYYSISGTVVDAKTKEVLPFANVYFSQTLKGATSDPNGNFQIDNVKPGSYDLVASFVGYQTLNAKVEIVDSDYENLQIQLKVDVQSLVEVEVETKRDREWEQKVKAFERAVLGSIPFSKKCEILNPWVLSFSGSKSVQSATASKPIEIVNRALGFRIFMTLNQYFKTPEVLTYKGYFQFQLIEAVDEKEKKQWVNNREAAYNGSITHFLKSLLDERLKEEGFYLVANNEEKTIITKNNLDRFVTVEKRDRYWKLELSSPITMTYQSPTYAEVYQETFLTPDAKKEILFDSYGVLKDPTSLSLAGHLPSEGLSTLLPLDYYQGQRLEVDPEILKRRSEFITTFKDYQESKPIEVFVRTDKEQYFSGEAIWFATYILNTASKAPIYSPSNLRVQLFDSYGNKLIENRIKSTNGVGKSNLILPDSLISGTYLVRAFAEGFRENAYERPIKVIDFLPSTQSGEKSVAEKLKLEFFPEGGQLIAKEKNRVAFKANSRSVSATLYNEKGKALMTANTMHDGMGLFELTPDEGEQYYLQVYDNEEKFYLPEIADAISLRIDQKADDVSVKVRASPGQTGNYFLLAHNNGRLQYLQDFDIQEEQEFQVSKEILAAGINHFTLFDAEKRPISERLIFLNSEDSAVISIDIADTVYSKRQQVTVNLSSLIERQDTLFTDISVSVLDLEQANSSVDMKTYFKLFSNLSLPYPTNYGDLYKSNLEDYAELYMLVYGWKKFTWKDFLDQEFENKSFNAGIDITGFIERKNGKPIANTDLTLFTATLGDLYSSSTDSLGMFSFENLNIVDTSNLILKLDGSKNMLNPPNLRFLTSNQEEALDWIEKIQIPKWLERSDEEKDEELIKVLAYKRKLNLDDQYTILDEVVVTTQKEREFDPRKTSLGKGNKSIYMDELPFTNFNTIFDIIDGRVPRARVIQVGNGMDQTNKVILLRGYIIPFRSIYDQSAQILVDNIPMSSADAGKLVNPNDIESVEIFSDASAAAFGARGGNGVIAFYTKRGKSKENDIQADPLVKTFVYDNAYYTFKSFESPDYNALRLTNDALDTRATLYWNPQISFTNYSDENFSFFTSDRETDLLIDIQGVTQDGQIIHETKLIRVSDDLR